MKKFVLTLYDMSTINKQYCNLRKVHPIQKNKSNLTQSPFHSCVRSVGVHLRIEFETKTGSFQSS